MLPPFSSFVRQTTWRIATATMSITQKISQPKQILVLERILFPICYFIRKFLCEMVSSAYVGRGFTFSQFPIFQTFSCAVSMWSLVAMSLPTWSGEEWIMLTNLVTLPAAKNLTVQVEPLLAWKENPVVMQYSLSRMTRWLSSQTITRISSPSRYSAEMQTFSCFQQL